MSKLKRHCWRLVAQIDIPDAGQLYGELYSQFEQIKLLERFTGAKMSRFVLKKMRSYMDAEDD